MGAKWKIIPAKPEGKAAIGVSASFQRVAAFSLAALLTLGAANVSAAEEKNGDAQIEQEATTSEGKAEKQKEHVGRLTVNEFLLAGVAPGVREEEIRQALGKPLYGDCEIMVFSNGLVAELDDEHPGVVEELAVAKPGTKARTPAGLTPGMAEEEIERQYGKADKKSENPLYTTYTYYSVDGKLKMKFTAKDGVILKIKCEFA